MTSHITISDYGTEIRWIGQDLIPIETPLGVPIVNPFSHKQMQFFKQYLVTGISLDEARTGILFGNYRPFMDIKEETYSRTRRTRHLVFNPFMKELEKYGEYAGSVGVMSGQAMANMMVAMLGLITWDIKEEPATDPNVATFEYRTNNRLFYGHFKIRARVVAEGVVLEDDWTTRGGSDMRTSLLPMANVVLLTHPKGFEQIAAEMVEEVRRARAAGVPYVGEIGAPSVELKDKDGGSSSTLDPSSFIVLGESLAAGMTNFSLIEPDQRESFPALVARQMGTPFHLPLVQGPGLGDPHGFPTVPVQHPVDMETTVLADFPPKNPASNLSVPGLTANDVVTGRPGLPLIHRHDARQTAVNFIFGMPEILAGTSAMPTLLEIAVSRRPTLALVALGSAEVLEAATAGDVTGLPDPASFGRDYRMILSALKTVGSTVVASTIPDPLDTAYFSSIDAASHVLKLPAAMLSGAYNLQPDDRITPNGLIEMGCQLGARKMGPLPDGSILPAQAAAAIRRSVARLNEEIRRAARENGATVFTLDSVLGRVAADGLRLGTRTLTAEFLGGFYSLNGYTPGRTGQAAIANELIAHLNEVFGASLARIDLSAIVVADPVADYQQPQGREFSMADMAASAASNGPGPVSKGPASAANGPAPRGKGKAPASQAARPPLPLRLPEGLEQELPLVSDVSYFGDTLRPVHTTDPQEAFYGLTGNLLFGGLALTDSRLQGSIRITFSEPLNDVTHFEVTVGDGLMGEDGRLEAPQFFKLPNVQQKIAQPPGMPITGDLNLQTGEVTNLKGAFMFMNSALFALVSVNPTFPKVPVSFPGEYGTAAAKFEPRADGKLDFTFQGTTFVPLSIIGVPPRFPLPFFTPDFNFASIPCNGTSLHPHVRLSTRPADEAPAAAQAPEIPTNTVREFVASVHNNTFGDDIDLNVAELGGPAAGRSHLAGRVQVQFGPRFDGRVPIAVIVMPPGGQLATLPQSPFAQAFKHAIPNGMYGHNELLRFPSQTYTMNNVSFLPDPLDIAHGVIDLKTGRVIGDLLMRGLITTNWLLAMVMLEDRTPRATFQFRGPASFEKGVNGQLVFRYNSGLLIPFPEGFRFPKADLQTAYSVGANSKLEPFLRLQAMHVAEAPKGTMSGTATRVKASTGEEFSYRYAVSASLGASSFEYTNHAQDATFAMRALTWVSFLNSRTGQSRPGEFDTVTFSGLGSWSKDTMASPHVAHVQICTSRDNPYVTIQVDGGATSNVNTKPEDAASTLP